MEKRWTDEHIILQSLQSQSTLMCQTMYQLPPAQFHDVETFAVFSFFVIYIYYIYCCLKKGLLYKSNLFTSHHILDLPVKYCNCMNLHWLVVTCLLPNQRRSSPDSNWVQQPRSPARSKMRALKLQVPLRKDLQAVLLQVLLPRWPQPNPYHHQWWRRPSGGDGADGIWY